MFSQYYYLYLRCSSSFINLLFHIHLGLSECFRKSQRFILGFSKPFYRNLATLPPNVLRGELLMHSLSGIRNIRVLSRFLRIDDLALAQGIVHTFLGNVMSPIKSISKFEKNSLGLAPSPPKYTFHR